MEGRQTHIAANMEGMSVMVVDGNRPEDGGFWNPPLHTLLHPLNHDLLTQTTCARPNPHFSLHTHSVWACVIVRGWGPIREWGVFWKRSTGNIISEIKIQDIKNHTCTKYKPHGSVHPLLCCNSYCTKRWSIFGVFFLRVMGFAVTSCIFQESSMSSTRALIQMIFIRLWQELKSKRNIAQTLICSANRESKEKSAWKLPM